jgi:hypothetical protein
LHVTAETVAEEEVSEMEALEEDLRVVLRVDGKAETVVVTEIVDL